jgi:hypothetical protein
MPGTGMVGDTFRDNYSFACPGGMYDTRSVFFFKNSQHVIVRKLIMVE